MPLLIGASSCPGCERENVGRPRGGTYRYVVPVRVRVVPPVKFEVRLPRPPHAPAVQRPLGRHEAAVARPRPAEESAASTW